MKKRIITLAAVATLVVVMAACGGTEQTNNTLTSTVAPTIEAEATTAPTPEPTATPEPTPTETPAEPAGNPADVAEDPNFAKIKEMTAEHLKWGDDYYYSALEEIIETMDETRYVVTAVGA